MLQESERQIVRQYTVELMAAVDDGDGSNWTTIKKYVTNRPKICRGRQSQYNTHRLYAYRTVHIMLAAFEQLIARS